MVLKSVNGSIRHRKLPIVFVSVGEGDGEDVVARGGNVELRAVGRCKRLTVDRSPRVGGDLHSHMADVLCEDNGERVAVDGGFHGVAARGALYGFLLHCNRTVAISCADGFRTTPYARYQ